MRIFLYVNDYPIADVIGHQNGVTRAVHGFATGLVHCGIEVIVLSEGALSARYLKEAGYLHFCFRQAKTFTSWSTSPDLLKFLAQTIAPQDILILNGGFHSNVSALAQHLRRLRIPYIMAPHLVYDAAMFQKRPYLKHSYWYLREFHLLRQAQAIQVLDPRHSQELQQRGIHRPVIIVPNGIMVEGERARPIASPHMQAASIFFLGRLSIQTKGLDLLLDAFANLRSDDWIKPLLTLQGDDVGDHQLLFHRIDQLNLHTRVKLQDADYKTNPLQLIAAHDIVCLPSRTEGFGLVALEAMLAGRVLLVSENAGIAPHVAAAGCGVVVKPEQISIQTGLQWLLDQRSNWPVMGQQGQNYALQYLQWPTIAQQAINDYQRLLQGQTNSRQAANILLTR